MVDYMIILKITLTKTSASTTTEDVPFAINFYQLVVREYFQIVLLQHMHIYALCNLF